jgi:hypothetical protein
LHERVTVRTRDGWRAEGVSHLRHSRDGEEVIPVLAIRQDDGSTAWCEPDSIESVEVHAAINAADAHEALTAALDRPLSLSPEGVELSVVVGDHERVRVRIALERHTCLPAREAETRPLESERDIY